MICQNCIIAIKQDSCSVSQILEVCDKIVKIAHIQYDFSGRPGPHHMCLLKGLPICKARITYLYHINIILPNSIKESVQDFHSVVQTEIKKLVF